jgi:kinetochore protein Fta7
MPMLKARLRNIPQDVVEARWGPLVEKAREEVLDVVKAAERPVLMTFRKEKQKAEAQEALRVMMRKYGPYISFLLVVTFGGVGLQYS